MIQIKQGASIRGLTPQMTIALFIATAIFESHSLDCVLTEGTGSKHGRGSLHYVGLAIDLRIKHSPESLWGLIKTEIESALGAEFDVVLETSIKGSEHIHIEFQPK